MKADKDAEIDDAEHVAAIAEFNEKAALARVAKLEAALRRSPATINAEALTDEALGHIEREHLHEARAVLKDAPQ